MTTTTTPTTRPALERRRFVSPELVDLRTAWTLERDLATAPDARHDAWCQGRHGWMLEDGLDTVLEPVLRQDTYGAQAFYRFFDLDGAAAETLLDRLDPGYLAEERQNDGPSIGAVLRALAAHPDRLRAHGYVVGPGRCDERITVEGVLVRTDDELVVDRHHSRSCQCEHLVRYVAEDLGIDDMRVPPHEVGPWWGFSFNAPADEGEDEERWYRLWWD
ncbi:hypothetical protein [Isoptericola variabilis]|uniref:Uncharacterized protein n=1 Tax=Isoptericola variabilis (strain 225) TaxID=743718 RepID=F6FRB4_ISOV2|nr:hypothetical protein [Isoptericola variabilis]AEG42974.1 hypothetical protein Isova_0164 [Isoptericola variabilis 225]TWH30054.1 hypothetical protein L600_003300000200 [Isoptericola variabilis J7]